MIWPSQALCIVAIPANSCPAFASKLPVTLFCRRREDGRVTLCILTALNVFLAAQGLDICSKAARLHQAAQPLVLRIWRSARDSRTQETLVHYLRIQLHLQVCKRLPSRLGCC